MPSILFHCDDHQREISIIFLWTNSREESLACVRIAGSKIRIVNQHQLTVLEGDIVWQCTCGHLLQFLLLIQAFIMTNEAIIALLFRYFLTGKPIPSCKTPTTDVLEYYTSAKSRGYLAQPADIETHRKELAEKYGYTLPELSPKVAALASEVKSPLQIFYGLQPGWIVNLPDRKIIKPKDPQLEKLYQMDSMF